MSRIGPMRGALTSTRSPISRGWITVNSRASLTQPGIILRASFGGGPASASGVASPRSPAPTQASASVVRTTIEPVTMGMETLRPRGTPRTSGVR